MASSNNTERPTVRTAGSQRALPSTGPMNMPGRHQASRSGLHAAASLGALNPAHRVSRRKSMNASNVTPTAAAIRAMDGASLKVVVSPGPRSLSPARGAGARGTGPSPTLLRPPTGYRAPGALDPSGESAILDDGSTVDARAAASSSRQKTRRASEGACFGKVEAKRSTAELRCEKCGKGYKHSSCLTKHLWEHTPEWSYTSKLLISKHQQVQLLEAASALMAINQDFLTVADFPRPVDSDRSTASPPVSGSSDRPDDDDDDDDISSVDTTPPPVGEQKFFLNRPDPDSEEHVRHSSTSSVFSQSYQSGPSGSVAGSIPTTASYGSFFHHHHLHPGNVRSLSTSGNTYRGLSIEVEAGLAAAVELCHFGTPRTGPAHVEDVPPVPPLPARYASYGTAKFVGGSYSGYQLDLAVPTGPTHRISDERDVKMHDDDDYNDDDHAEEGIDPLLHPPHCALRGPDDDYDDDDGVFGTMEE